MKRGLYVSFGSDQYRIGEGTFTSMADLKRDADGVSRIHLLFKLRDDDGTRHSLLRGAEQFQDVLGHFGPRAQGIAAFWVKASGLDDNLREFNRLTGAPHHLPLEEAARQTWTGRQALKNGFTQVKILRPVGEPGRYTEVKVNFDRPRGKLSAPVPQLDVEMDAYNYMVSYNRWGDEDSDWAQRIWVGGELEGKHLNVFGQKGSEVTDFPDFKIENELPKILKHFEGRYDDILFGINDFTPEAIEAINRLTAKPGGIPLDAALRENEMVRLLTQKGFRVTEVQPVGDAGQYTNISLRFERPP